MPFSDLQTLTLYFQLKWSPRFKDRVSKSFKITPEDTNYNAIVDDKIAEVTRRYGLEIAGSTAERFRQIGRSRGFRKMLYELNYSAHHEKHAYLYFYSLLQNYVLN